MVMTTKPPNSQECKYGGYKLSNFCAEDSIEHSENILAITVGADEDDTFYEGTDKRGRVQLGIELHSGEMMQMDLEDMLRFAKQRCAGIYERVNAER